MTTPSPRLKEKMKAFHKILFSFYQKEGRAMPWRETKDLYRILVSEIMLQQTQVDRVRVKYKEFLKHFPTAKVLAKARLGDVLRVWSGLGYNRRAKYLHECLRAALVQGGFPKTMEGLVTLPGIGRSTAAGVMAFAWNLPEPMIDTNLRRVLHRVFFPRTKKTDEELYHFAKAMIPKGKGRAWNYAMLDVAAMKCTARNHALDCPLTPLHGRITEAPRKKIGIKFIDTDRYARGRIMEALRNSQKGLSVSALAKVSERDSKKTASLLKKLCKEGLMVKLKKGTRFALPMDKT